MGYKIWIGPKKTAKGTESRAAAQAECDRANEPIEERRILALAALDWHRNQAEPLDGAAAVRELTGAPMVPGEPRYERARAAVEEVLPGWFPPRDTAPLPTVAAVENDGRDKRAVARMLAGVADVENDGDRGPPSRARPPLRPRSSGGRGARQGRPAPHRAARNGRTVQGHRPMRGPAVAGLRFRAGQPAACPVAGRTVRCRARGRRGIAAPTPGNGRHRGHRAFAA